MNKEIFYQNGRPVEIGDRVIGMLAQIPTVGVIAGIDTEQGDGPTNITIATGSILPVGEATGPVNLIPAGDGELPFAVVPGSKQGVSTDFLHADDAQGIIELWRKEKASQQPASAPEAETKSQQ